MEVNWEHIKKDREFDADLLIFYVFLTKTDSMEWKPNLDLAGCNQNVRFNFCMPRAYDVILNFSILF